MNRQKDLRSLQNEFSSIVGGGLAKVNPNIAQSWIENSNTQRLIKRFMFLTPMIGENLLGAKKLSPFEIAVIKAHILKAQFDHPLKRPSNNYTGWNMKNVKFATLINALRYFGLKVGFSTFNYAKHNPEEIKRQVENLETEGGASYLQSKKFKIQLDKTFNKSYQEQQDFCAEYHVKMVSLEQVLNVLLDIAIVSYFSNLYVAKQIRETFFYYFKKGNDRGVVSIRTSTPLYKKPVNYPYHYVVNIIDDVDMIVIHPVFDLNREKDLGTIYY